MTPEKCIFCKIHKGLIDSEILYGDDNCFVIRDISPRAPVHLLVIPVLHITRLVDLNIQDTHILGGMLKVAVDMAQRENISDSGYRLVVNQGDNAGQVVPHLHLHILGAKSLAEMG